MATRTTTILFIQPVAERGGSDHALLRMIRLLPRDRFISHVVMPAPSPLAEELEHAGACLHVVPMRRISTSHGPWDWLAFLAGWPLALGRLWRLARRGGGRGVHPHPPPPWDAW